MLLSAVTVPHCRLFAPVIASDTFTQALLCCYAEGPMLGTEGGDGIRISPPVLMPGLNS